MKITFIDPIIQQILFKSKFIFKPILAYILLLSLLMVKASNEMDLDDWEIIPYDEFFLDFHQHEDDKKCFDPKDTINMNCSICPSPTSCHIIRTSENSNILKGTNELVRVPTGMEPTIGKIPYQETEEEHAEVPIVEIDNIPQINSTKIKDPNLVLVVENQGMDSRVLFNKAEEKEYVNMKMNSPKSSSKEIKPQTEVGLVLQSEEETIVQEKVNKCKGVGGGGGGLNIWSCGIGTLCFIGVVAATTYIFIFGSKRRNKYHHHIPKLQFQIYADNKKMKQVVQQDTRLNQAISAAVRSVPLFGVHIISGGHHHYEGLQSV